MKRFLLSDLERRSDRVGIEPGRWCGTLLKRLGALLAGADAHRLSEIEDEDLAVSDPSGIGGALDRFDGALERG
jgi:hypothetical protein